MALHVHDHHEVIVVLEGRMFVKGEKGESLTGQAGQVLVYPTGIPHEEQSDPSAPVRTLFFSFEGTAPKGLSLFSGREGRVPVLARFLFRDFVSFGQDLNQANACGYLNLLFQELAPPATIDGRDVLIQKAQFYLADHYARPITLQDIASACHCSKFHFSRIFKEGTGMTPMQALRAVRIQQAKQLLRTTILGMSAIAEQTGFSNEYHLSREFKKHTGLTASSFRRDGR